MEKFVKIKSETDQNYETWQAVEQFGKDKYFLEFLIDFDKFYVAFSSGNKRKYKQIFEQKDYKSSGGFKALIWARNTIFDFAEFKKLKYTIVGWADSRRKRIYKRALCSYGFYEGRINGTPCLIKKNF